MAVSNASLDLQGCTQSEAEKVRRLHDDHEAKDSKNATIDKTDTALNRDVAIIKNPEKILEKQYGSMIEEHNVKLEKQLSEGKISLARFEERKWDIDKYLNHSGKGPKKAYALGVCYIGDEKQTEQKLKDLGFDYKVKTVTDEDGLKHKHFELTDDEQREEWSNLWRDTFVNIAKYINEHEGIKIYQATIHLDEASPHAHFKCINCGHTKSGKPSYSLNQAVSDFNVSCGEKERLAKATEKTPNRRISGEGTFQTMRSITDKLCVDTFNKTLADHGYETSYTFKHKGKLLRGFNKLPPDLYKSLMSAISTYVGELDKREDKLNKRESDVKEYENETIKYEAKVKKALSDAYTAITGDKSEFIVNDSQDIQTSVNNVLEAVNDVKLEALQAGDDAENSKQFAQELSDKLTRVTSQVENEQQKLVQKRNQREQEEQTISDLQDKKTGLLADIKQLEQTLAKKLSGAGHVIRNHYDEFKKLLKWFVGESNRADHQPKEEAQVTRDQAMTGVMNAIDHYDQEEVAKDLTKEQNRGPER